MKLKILSTFILAGILSVFGQTVPVVKTNGIWPSGNAITAPIAISTSLTSLVGSTIDLRLGNVLLPATVGSVTGLTISSSAGLTSGVTTSTSVPRITLTLSANLLDWNGKTAPSGTVVGTTDVQSLTNKTISGSTLGNNQITGTNTGSGSLSLSANIYSGSQLGGASLSIGGSGLIGGDLTINGNLLPTNPLGLAYGGTGASGPSAARTSLGLAIGTNVEAWSANLDGWAGTPSSSFVTWTGSVSGQQLVTMTTGNTLVLAGGSNVTLTTNSTSKTITISAASTGGTVTGFVATPSNGVLAGVTLSTSVPTLTISLGAITPTSITTSGNISSNRTDQSAVSDADGATVTLSSTSAPIRVEAVSATAAYNYYLPDATTVPIGAAFTFIGTTTTNAGNTTTIFTSAGGIVVNGASSGKTFEVVSFSNSSAAGDWKVSRGYSTTTIPNTHLTNSQVTVGSTVLGLGSTSTTLVGLTGITTSNLTNSGAISGFVISDSTGKQSTTTSVPSGSTSLPIALLITGSASPAANSASLSMTLGATNTVTTWSSTTETLATSLAITSTLSTITLGTGAVVGRNVISSPTNALDLVYPADGSLRFAATTAYSSGPGFQAFGDASGGLAGQMYFDYGSTATTAAGRSITFRNMTAGNTYTTVGAFNAAGQFSTPLGLTTTSLASTGTASVTSTLTVGGTITASAGLFSNTLSGVSVISGTTSSAAIGIIDSGGGNYLTVANGTSITISTAGVNSNPSLFFNGTGDLSLLSAQAGSSGTITISTGTTGGNVVINSGGVSGGSVNQTKINLNLMDVYQNYNSAGMIFSGQQSLGLAVNVTGQTFKDILVANNGTTVSLSMFTISQSTLAASHANVTTPTASSFTINGAPINGTNITITNPLSLWVRAGLSNFQGGIQTNSLSNTGTGSFTGTLSTATLTGTIGTFSSTLAASNLSGTNTGDQTSVTGNAGTATALQTARNINGVAFDGTGNITVTAAGPTLTGTSLSTTILASSITSHGTLTTGTWNATVIGMAYGGLGRDLSGVAKGGLFTGTGSGALGILAVGTDGQVLTADAASTGGVKWAAGGGGSGTVTTVSSANTNIIITASTSAPVLTMSTSNAQMYVPANPTGTATTSGSMQGMAMLYTPSASTTVIINQIGSYKAGAATMTISARYGTGSAPANNAALTGTIISTTSFSDTGTGTVRVYAITGIVSGLTIGTQYWFDLSMAESTSTTSLTGIVTTIHDVR